MSGEPEAARRRGLERLSVTGWFALVVGGLVVVAALGLVAGVLALDRLSTARELLVDEVDPALVAAERLSRAYLDQETGVRRYALAGELAFLQPYRRGRREEARGTRTLRAIGRDGTPAGLRETLRRTRAAALAWRRAYAQPTLAAVAAGRLPPPAEVGKPLFDGLRVALADLRARLAAERAAARADLDRSADLVLLLFLAAGALLLAAVLAAAAALRATIIAPVSRLADDVRRVADGEFELVLEPSGPREIADLGRDVDAMRDRILYEVNALQQAEYELTRQAAELQRSNQELEQFAYVASHDLQEPLRKVASFTQMLERRYEGQLDERAQQYIAFAVDGAKRMQDLINDLLAFSRVGRITRPHDRVPAADLVERARANLAAVLEETGAEVRVGALPEVQGDTGLLTLVFQNLIANAVKFRAPDRPPRVAIGAEPDAGAWRFTVTDNGIGIEEEYAERIFVIFQRLHTRVAYEGTGIGLAMCRKIVEYHGGRIWLGPAPAGGGTAFCFTLPPADEEENPA